MVIHFCDGDCLLTTNPAADIPSNAQYRLTQHRLIFLGGGGTPSRIELLRGWLPFGLELPQAIDIISQRTEPWDQAEPLKLARTFA